MAASDEGSSVSARSENDAPERGEADEPRREHGEVDGLTGEREEAYGPIGFRRYVKGDGRALILYTHGELTGGGPAPDRPAHE
jgi:hypothetical protein